MESKSILTADYRLDSAERFVYSIKNNQYYFFVGNHINPNTVTSPTDNPREALLSVYYNMIFGKKVQTNDVNLLVKRHDYVANTVYSMYDHTDPYLYDRQFYVMVKEGTQYDVFKCLDNNMGARSLVSPSRTNVNTENDDFYYPTDGYRWKYLYSMNSATVNKFATQDFFPVTVDEGVKAKAEAGAIDVIAVKTAGKGYANYLLGQFGVGDIRLSGDPLLYGISTAGAKTSNGFYDACWLYVSSGPGAGQFRMIESYTSNSTYNFVELTNAFDPTDPPQNTSTFEIYPSVRIKGDGSETIEAHGRAIIDPIGNTVNHIEMLDRGRDYNLASASVMYSASVGVTELAGLKPIYSPTLGHGYNPPAELGCRYVGLGISLVGSEYGTVITGNDYSQWGLLKNPLFKKVTLSSSDMNKQFVTNELVHKIKTVDLLPSGSTVKDANNNVTNQLVTSSDPTTSVSVGDRLLISYANNYMLANTISVSNTSIYFDRSIPFNTIGQSVRISKASVVSTGLVDGYSTDKVDLTNVSGTFATGDVFVGAETGTHGTVNSVKITDVTKSFNTFMQAYTYIGYMTQGQFTPDEQLFQVANAVANAKYHSTANDTVTGTKRFYVTNQTGVFNTAVDGTDLTDEIIGYTSGSIARLTNKYLPDLVFGSGKVMYIENFQSITREDEKTETFKLVLNF